MSTDNRCRSCNAPIQWAFTAKGRRMPVDVKPADDGNLLLTPREYYVVATYLDEEGIVAARVRGARLFKSHFATCPDRIKWRKK